MAINPESQMGLVLSYFKQNPNRTIDHPEIVDWVTKEWQKRTGKVFRDPDRAIRKLHEMGLLIKVGKGRYRYDPNLAQEETTYEFTEQQKRDIFAKDNYTCVVCGATKTSGAELHADHIKPKDKGGINTVDNGQTLCSQCNNLKKNYNLTELFKRNFIKLYKQAEKKDDHVIMAFCRDILAVYAQHKIDDHIH